MKVLKSITTIVAALLISVPAFSEGDTKIGGIRAGYQISDIYFDGSGTGSLNGFYVGLFKNNKIIPTLHWTAGLEYFQTGYEVSSDTRRAINTLSVPLFLKFKVGPAYAMAGLSGNFKLSEENKLNGVDLEENANTVDIPVGAGVGFRIAILNVEARYNWGMMDVDDGGGRHRYFQVGLGASF